MLNIHITSMPNCFTWGYQHHKHVRRRKHCIWPSMRFTQHRFMWSMWPTDLTSKNFPKTFTSDGINKDINVTSTHFHHHQNIWHGFGMNYNPWCAKIRISIDRFETFGTPFLTIGSFRTWQSLMAMAYGFKTQESNAFSPIILSEM